MRIKGVHLQRRSEGHQSQSPRHHLLLLLNTILITVMINAKQCKNKNKSSVEASVESPR
jgi:hypothetical protein